MPGRIRGFEPVFLWEVAAGRVTPPVPASKARRLIRCIAVFPPGADALALLSAGREAEEIKVYRTADPFSPRSIARARSVTAPAAPIGFASAAFSPDARKLAYGAIYGSGLGSRATGEICLYDLVKRKIFRKVTNAPACLSSLVFPAQGRLAGFPSTARCRPPAKR